MSVWVTSSPSTARTRCRAAASTPCRAKSITTRSRTAAPSSRSPATGHSTSTTSIPPTIGFLVQLVKGTSLASIIGFVEITRAAQVINNATFRPFTIFALVALVVGSFIIYNTFSIVVAQRSREMALLRAIGASRTNGTLTLSVRNDGPSLPANWEAENSGIGIANVRTRLKSLYGEGFTLNLRNQDGGGVEASVSLPFVVAASSK